MKNNIPKIYGASFLAGLMFYYGIEKLFLFSLGSSESSVALVAVVTALVVVLFDIPLGYTADRIGRKFTLACALLSLGLANFFFSQANNVPEYLVGCVFFGLFIVGVSGSFQAMVYDTLHQLKQTDRYNKTIGRAYASMYTAQAIAVFSSGFIAQEFGFRMNHLLAIIPAILSLSLILTLKEPAYHKPDKLLGWRAHIRTAMKVVTYTPNMKRLSVMILTLAIAIWISNTYSQFVFNDYEISLYMVSILSSLALLAAVVGRLSSGFIGKHFSTSWVIMIIIFSMIGLTSQTIVLPAMIIYYGIAHGLFNNVEASIQQILPKSLRATSTSVFSSLTSFVVIISGLMVSLALGYLDIFSVYFVFSLVLIAISVSLLVFSQRRGRLLPMLSRRPTPS